MLAAELDELRERYFLREALDAVVAGVHLEQQRRARVERLGVVLEMRAVGGADLQQPAAALHDDVRHAEAVADLDQLAARHRHLLAVREGVEGEIDGGGVVVDHGRGLGAGQPAQQIFDQRVTIAAPAGIEVVFEIHRGSRLHHRRNRLGRQRRAPEVGVQQRAGEVDHRLHARCAPGRDRRRDFLDDLLGHRRGAARAGAQRLAVRAEARLNLGDEQRMVEGRAQRGEPGVLEHLVHGGQCRERSHGFTGHGTIQPSRSRFFCSNSSLPISPRA